MRFLSICFVAFMAVPGIPQWADAQTKCSQTAVQEPDCSYEAMNGNCVVEIDRWNPITPPTIYMHRGSRLTVRIIHPSPFETLSLDPKSDNVQPPPDQYQSNFTTIATAIGALEISVPPPPGKFEAVKVPTGEILKRQQALLKKIQSVSDISKPQIRDALRKIRPAVLPLPAQMSADADATEPFEHTRAWADKVDNDLKGAFSAVFPDQPLDPVPTQPSASMTMDQTNAQLIQKALDKPLTGYQSQIDSIEGTIEGLPQTGTNSVLFATLADNQKTLRSAIADARQIWTELLDLRYNTAEVAAVKPPADVECELADPHKNSRDIDTVTTTLDYTNKLSPVAKRVSASKYVDVDSAALSGIADPPAKSNIITIAAQFQNPNRYEISSGLLVPIKPYHSYSAAWTSTGTSAQVVSSKIYTVIPTVDFNILLKQGIAKQQRVAGFFSLAVGYCPATTSVAFGAGPSISWRSIVGNLMVDMGRDQKLAGGWGINQSLGSASAPATTNHWIFYFAPGLSVRIPLGGSSQ